MLNDKTRKKFATAREDLKEYTRSLRDLSESREESNFEFHEGQEVKNDYHLLNCFITQCDLAWGTDDLMDCLKEARDEVEQFARDEGVKLALKTH